MDRTLINVASILLGGAGLLTVLTGFNVPELNMSFFGQNPFAVKRDAIENVMNWLFTLVALIGLALQLGAEIWGGKLPERRYDAKFYVWCTVGGVVAVAALVWLLTLAGNRVARSIWWPKIIASQAEVFESSVFVVEHDGWREDQLTIKDTLSATDAQRHRSANLSQAEDRIAQIEKLIEVRPEGDLVTRIARLRPLFSQ